jgi:hypothetical protein
MGSGNGIGTRRRGDEAEGEGGMGGMGMSSPAGRGARSAMGEWVSEMTGSGEARAPTEEEIAT